MKSWKSRSLALLAAFLAMAAAGNGWGAALRYAQAAEPAADAAVFAEEVEAGPSAETAAVLELGAGEFLYDRNMSEARDPGGLAKLMTVLLLVESCDLEETVAFSEILYSLGEGGERLGLMPGEEITLYDAACALLFGPGDDVANGIAEYVAGSPAAFAERMNARAAELGCVNTFFSDPGGHGDGEQHTCARDLALIAGAAYENASFRELCALTEYSIPATNLTDSSRYLVNSHQMFRLGSEEYQTWCTGGMESVDSRGGEGLVTFGTRRGRTLVCVALGEPDSGAAYRETAQLLAEGFVHRAAETDAPETEPDSVVPRESAGETEAPLPLSTESPDTAPSLLEESTGEAILSEEPESEAAPAQEAVQDRVPDRLAGYLRTGQAMVSAYAEDHFEVVFFAGCVFMLLLFILIVLLLRRCVTDSRIRRRRRREEEIRRAREEQIEQMSVEELEAELRRKLDNAPREDPLAGRRDRDGK